MDDTHSTSSSGGSDASSGSGRTRSCAGGPLQHQHQHQQDHHHQQQSRQRQQQQGQEHDLRRMLDLALANLSHDQRGIACELHPISRAERSLALSSLQHLSLERFDDKKYPTCEVVYLGGRDDDCFARAVMPDPPIPWGTLADLHAAGGHLESLDIRQCQAEPLLAGSGTAATAPVLAATLAGRRSLRVTELAQEEDSEMNQHFDGVAPGDSHRPAQLRCVTRLISSCSGLTKLVLETADPDHAMEASVLHGPRTAAADEEVVEVAAMEEPQGKEKGTDTAGTGRGGPLLPQLGQLEVKGFVVGFLPHFLGAGVAPGLTSCRLTSQQDVQEYESYMETDLLSLAACSGLQELQLDSCYSPDWQDNDIQVPDQLLRSSAFTKLVVSDCGVGVYGVQVREVRAATQLRHLGLQGNTALVSLPRDLSSLQQLTFLDVSGTGVEELPQQLGEWMRQLQVLAVENTQVAAIPTGLQQLTCLRAAHSGVASVAAVQHLVGLQQLQLHGNPLAPSFQQLSLFTALQEMSLSISEGGAQVAPTPLPLLRALRIQADDPWRAAGQLVGAGPHLTSLGLYSTWRGRERAAAVGQLGVLPVLQQLVLKVPLVSLWAAGPLLVQQPQLTSLSIAWTHSTGQSSRFETYLREYPLDSLQLSLSGGIARACLPAAFTQFTGLRVLRLSGPCTPSYHLGVLPEAAQSAAAG